MYHVSLELTADQIADLKMAALKKRTTVKGFIADLVVGALEKQSGEPVAGSRYREKVPAKKK